MSCAACGTENRPGRKAGLRARPFLERLDAVVAGSGFATAGATAGGPMPLLPRDGVPVP